VLNPIEIQVYIQFWPVEVIAVMKLNVKLPV
jgi:hypothetical protein